ncbi:hypothetical protein EYV94_27660 [Puteibacter caeruleilacunae]|nr:hypothetical protein EYV94_27660 [Puteibacter caeruleilacunae]
MDNKGKLIFISIILICIGCKCPVKTGVVQSSFSVEQSKELGVFLEEYTSSLTEVSLKGITFKIEEAWIENYWEYKNQQRVIEKVKGASGYIRLNPEADLFYIMDHLQDKRIGISGNKLTFEPVLDRDTLTLSFHSKIDTVEIYLIKE